LKLKQTLSCMLGLLFALSFASDGEAAGRVYDVGTGTTVTTEARQDNKSNIEKRHRKKKEQKPATEEKTNTIQERIEAILHPVAKKKNSVVESYGTSIEGLPLASQRQCVEYLLRNNPYPDLSVSPEQLVEFYYSEGGREGIRPDAAFAQAIKETGFFRYGGTVTPDQNNYCGLGTTSATVKGGYFATAELGVRAQIQHLMAYCTTRLPQTTIVDPRYWLVREVYGDDVLTQWTDLNGRWAVPGPDYGESIMFILSQILLEP